ncbi:MAG: F0F1 ATP synthase subunit A [Leptospiraceae bacterium]|nr:F0F1 ATP synthase subunit A [Leptospiraceae bacterium]
MIKYLIILLLSTISLNPLSASGGEGHEQKEFNLADVIDHHLGDQVIFPVKFGGRMVVEGDPDFDPNSRYIFEDHHSHKKYHFVDAFEMHITKRVTMMWIVTFFLLVTFIPIARKIASNPYKVQSRGAGMVESILQFLKDEAIDPNMHGHAHGYYGYLFSLFFFILFCNLFGLVPSMGELTGLLTGAGSHSTVALVWSGITVTGDISVTATLAIITLIMIYVTGFMYQGPLFPIYSVPNGVPIPLYLLMFPLEFIVSPFAKAFALTVRLLANMTAGHVVLLALLGFIFEFQSYLIALIAVPGAIAIYMLEIFVAFLQAFIFTLLTSLFVGSSMHRH